MPPKFFSGIQDCPHCLAHVIILSDAICPRCQGDARDTSLSNPNRTSVWLFTRDKIPSHCLRCGIPTDRRISIEHTESWQSPADSSDSPAKFRLGLNVLGLFGFVLRPLFRSMFRILFGARQQEDRQFERIAIAVPECCECSSGPVFPIAASMQDSAIKVAAHRTFADAHRIFNEPQ